MLGVTWKNENKNACQICLIQNKIYLCDLHVSLHVFAKRGLAAEPYRWCTNKEGVYLYVSQAWRLDKSNSNGH